MNKNNLSPADIAVIESICGLVAFFGLVSRPTEEEWKQCEFIAHQAIEYGDAMADIIFKRLDDAGIGPEE